MTKSEGAQLQPRMGGKPQLTAFLKANRDVREALRPSGADPSVATGGLPEAVASRFDGRFRVEVIHEPAATPELLLRQLEGAVEAPANQTRLSEGLADVVILSGESMVSGADWDGTPSNTPPPLDIDRELERMRRIVQLLKDLGLHVLIFNCSTVDPDDTTYNYRLLDREPMALRAHRANLVLAKLSSLEGVSVVDVDLILADMGAAEHVIRPLEYSAQAGLRIREEVLRILEEYGFFEERPLVAQIAVGDAR